MAQSGTVTLLFTDLVNSTDQLQQAGDEAGERWFRVHHKLMTNAVTAGGGEELQWLGDGMLAAFPSSADAVRCAINVQQTGRRYFACAATARHGCAAIPDPRHARLDQARANRRRHPQLAMVRRSWL